MNPSITDAEAGPRIALCRSLLNQRPATARTYELAQMALEGASVDDLLALERLNEVAADGP